MESTVAEVDVAARCLAPLQPQRVLIVLRLSQPPGTRHLPPPPAAIRVERGGSTRQIGLRHRVVAPPGLGQDLVVGGPEIRLVELVDSWRYGPLGSNGAREK